MFTRLKSRDRDVQDRDYIPAVYARNPAVMVTPVLRYTIIIIIINVVVVVVVVMSYFAH